MKTYQTALRMTITFALSLFFMVNNGRSQTNLFTEGWETASIGQTPPAGWSTDVVSGANLTYFKQVGVNPGCNPYAGTRMVEFQSSSAYGTQNRLKRTLPFSTIGYAVVNVDFRWYTSTGYQGSDDQVTVQYSTNGTTWYYGPTFHRSSTQNTWRFENGNLNSMGNKTNVYIAFLFYSEAGENCHLDEVHVTGYVTAPTPPSVFTEAANFITARCAKLNGSINPHGTETTVTFEYGVNPYYGTTIVEGGSATGNSFVPVSTVVGYQVPLIPGHHYYYRAIGTSAGGTVYGADSMFTTLDTIPFVTTLSAGNIGANTATVHGLASANGDSTTVSFQYGLTTSYGYNKIGTPGYLPPDSVNQYIDGYLTGLSPSTLYHYRIKAVNSLGTVYGIDSIFTTTAMGTPPSVYTTHATSITANSATLNGNVNANGASTNVTFQYGLTTSYGTTVTYGTVIGNTLTPVSKPITGLTPSTLYHFRVVGSNTYGPSYGNDSVFTTNSNATLPTVITTNATNITPYSASLNGNVNANGSPTTVTFQYGLTNSYGTTLTYGIVTGNTLTPVIYPISGLTPSTVYHFRVVGVNSIGTSYGNDTTFTTLASGNQLPTVVTGDTYFIMTDAAGLSGYVNPNGTTATTGFQYGTTTAYGNTVSAFNVSGNTLQSITAVAYGLTPGTLYHYRAMATNAGGTAYGSDSTFVTTDSLVSVVTWAATNIGSSIATLNGYVNPGSSTMTVSFEYGLTASYGSTVAGNPSQCNIPQQVSALISSLLPNTTYHFRIKGTNNSGTLYGIDLTFTTGINQSCHAAFSDYADSSSVYTYHFIDQSTGLINTWIWNFGDGTSQTVTFPMNPNVIHTYTGTALSHIVCLTILGNDSTCFDVVCDTIIINTNHGCIANFTYSATPNTENLTQFIDLSQSAGAGPITSWSWDFGDPTSGTNNFSTIQNPLHQFTEAGSYLVCLTIHGTDSTCYDMTCKTIIVTGNQGCQALFLYSANPFPDNHTVNFTDLSTGNPVSWWWEFEPGYTSSLQNPVFTFDSAGIYHVCLTIITSSECTSTFCRDVVIYDSSNYHQLYGQVFAGNFPLASGIALIFSIDSVAPYCQLVDTCMIDSNGVYYFTMVPDGDFYIYAIPFSPAGYLPTYFGDALSWHNATLVHLGLPVNPYNIHLIFADTLLPGDANIAGTINLIGLKSTSIADKIVMILMDSNGNSIAANRVTSERKFEFSSIAYGTYLLKGELSGIESDVISVVVSAEHPEAKVNLTFSGKRITGLNTILEEVNAGAIYPNPVTDEAMITISTDHPVSINIELFNLMGEQVLKTNENLITGKSTLKINTGSLSGGLYTMRISSGNGINITRKLVKSE